MSHDGHVPSILSLLSHASAARTYEDVALGRELADVGAALHAIDLGDRQIGPEHVRAQVAALWRAEAPIEAQHVGLPSAQQR